MTSKTMEKDTKESMVANMAAMDRVNEEMKDQVEEVTGVGKVIIRHRLVNCLHDGKERLAAVENKVATYLNQGIIKKPAGYGKQDKISTATCMVCLMPPTTYNKAESLTAPSVMFEDNQGVRPGPYAHQDEEF